MITKLLFISALILSLTLPLNNKTQDNVIEQTQLSIESDDIFTVVHVYYSSSLTLAEIEEIRRDFLDSRYAEGAVTMHPLQPSDPYHDVWRIDPIKIGGTANVEQEIEEEDYVCTRPGCAD